MRTFYLTQIRKNLNDEIYFVDLGYIRYKGSLDDVKEIAYHLGNAICWKSDFKAGDIVEDKHAIYYSSKSTAGIVNSDFYIWEKGQVNKILVCRPFEWEEVKSEDEAKELLKTNIHIWTYEYD